MRCELCGQERDDVNEHHLIPRTVHSNKRVRKLFSRDEMKRRKVSLCRNCHKMVHVTIPEKELALKYNTLELLKAHPEIAKFVLWVRKHTPAGKVSVR